MKKIRLLALAAAASLGATFAPLALADLTIGVSISLTGPTSALGIPTKNGIAIWPKEIAGEKLNVIVLDDATDPTTAVKNTRRFLNEDKVDVIVGSVATPVGSGRYGRAASLYWIFVSNPSGWLAAASVSLPRMGSNSYHVSPVQLCGMAHGA